MYTRAKRLGGGRRRFLTAAIGLFQQKRGRRALLWFYTLQICCLGGGSINLRGCKRDGSGMSSRNGAVAPTIHYYSTRCTNQYHTSMLQNSSTIKHTSDLIDHRKSNITRRHDPTLKQTCRKQFTTSRAS
ncbi:hypothetical protein IQ06DRAFT_57284 [Phaeosphaeriaceae sp. SRC1lsM3a]|nr:hypothetical protein IQ06DRAFT_57284 [Stagonospora sp. SRC1lsM3a]